MKDIMESPEVFQAYAEIDYCLFLIEQISKQGKNRASLSPIEIEIGRVTGYSDAKNREDAESIIELCEVIIKNKKIINADYSHIQ